MLLTSCPCAPSPCCIKWWCSELCGNAEVAFWVSSHPSECHIVIMSLHRISSTNTHFKTNWVATIFFQEFLNNKNCRGLTLVLRLYVMHLGVHWKYGMFEFVYSGSNISLFLLHALRIGYPLVGWTCRMFELVWTLGANSSDRLLIKCLNAIVRAWELDLVHETFPPKCFKCNKLKRVNWMERELSLSSSTNGFVYCFICMKK